ncbi:MAG: GNAT family N-acetyltransferase [Bacteroidota bacterium]
MSRYTHVFQQMHIVRAYKPLHFRQVRSLLYAYGISRNLDEALGNYFEELASLPQQYGPPHGCILLGSTKQEPLGCVAFRPEREGICEMKRLYVSPQSRGQHVGKKLCLRLMDIAKARDYQIMRLDTHPSMRSAQRLYQSLGFYEIERYNDNPIPGIRFFERPL